MAERDAVNRTEIIPYLFYRDVPAALDWLTRAFGLTEDMRVKTMSDKLPRKDTMSRSLSSRWKTTTTRNESERQRPEFRLAFG